MKRILAIVTLAVMVAALLPAVALADWNCPGCNARWDNSMNYCGYCGKAKPVVTAAPSVNYSTDLNPNNKCKAQPSIYANARFRDAGHEPYDINSNRFSASEISRRIGGSREYGVFFKFTPNGADTGYQISRLDVVVTDPQGNITWTEGYPVDIVCDRNYFWYWNFFNLQPMFEQMNASTGIKTGVYNMDIYFNRQWAGKATFRMEN